MNEGGQKSGDEQARLGHEPRLPMPFAEFVGLMALMTALTALSIDIMLPALPQIGEYFALELPNDRQLVLTGYLVGLAAGQLVFGPLSDRYGRKPVLMIGLAMFILGSVGAAVADSFTNLFLARAMQGFGAASPRVISIAIVRDLFSGWQMARVTSLIMMVFIVVPVIAPSIGMGLLQLGPWPLMFHLLLVVGIICTIWAAFRLPETRSEGHARAPITLRKALRWTFTSLQTVGYTLATGFLFGCLMAYINSAQQVFVEVYDLGAAFPIAFGAVAGVQAFAALTNAHLVQRYGMRRVSHTALVAFCTSSLLLLAVAPFQPSFAVFAVLVAIAFYCFGVIVPNFNAIAMQPMGAVAGTASSFIGFYTTAAGALFGWGIGSYFNGSVQPLAIGFAVLSTLSLVTVLLVEGWKGMFRGE